MNSGRWPVSLRSVMTFHQQKLLVLATWVATVAIVGLIVAIDKPERWMLIALLALIPAAMSISRSTISSAIGAS